MVGAQSRLMEYVQNGSEQAFRELVSAYVNFVFSTALRIVGGDRALAEDVTQTVFVDLACKASGLPTNVQLGGWLHRHTCFVARKTLRREQRRIAREKQSIELNDAEDYTEANLAQVSLVLDEAINALGEQDRNAIVLRFFEDLDFRSIAQSIGSTEDAARMRVARAIEKMGNLLKRRGLILSVSAFAFVMSGRLACAAPRGLAIRSVSVALAKSKVPPSFIALFKNAFLTRLNVGIIGTASAIALAVPLLLLLPGFHRKHASTVTSQTATFTPADFAGLDVEDTPADAPSTAPDRRASAPGPQAVVSAKRDVPAPAPLPLEPAPQPTIASEAPHPPLSPAPASVPSVSGPQPGFGGAPSRSFPNPAGGADSWISAPAHSPPPQAQPQVPQNATANKVSQNRSGSLTASSQSWAPISTGPNVISANQVPNATRTAQQTPSRASMPGPRPSIRSMNDSSKPKPSP